MDNALLFAETQKFTQWWLWLILLSYISILVIVFGVIVRRKLTSKLIRNTAFAFTLILLVIPTSIFFSLRLETQIRKDGVYVKFPPFYSSFTKYQWQSISKSYVREYNAINEYGGWGFRDGQYGKALNASGNQGLQLVFNNNDKLLIGTNKPVQLTETLIKIGQLKQ